MISFKESIYEWITFKNGMRFVVSSLIGKEWGFSFLPDSKTIDSFDKEEQVKAIEESLKKGVPNLAKFLHYSSAHPAAGITFELNRYDIVDEIQKLIK